MNPAIAHVFQFFAYEHLPPQLQQISKPFCELAQTVASGPQNQETTVALRKLLEAKDAAVRAAGCAMKDNPVKFLTDPDAK